MIDVTEAELGKGSLKDLGSRLTKMRELSATADDLERAIYTAKAVTLAREYVARNIGLLATLAGSPLGFEVDQAYSTEQLIGPLTAAFVMGLLPTGRQFAIIKGNLYPKADGYRRLFSFQPHITDIRVILGEVEVIREPGHNSKGKAVPGVAKVQADVSCKIHGRQCRALLTLNNDMDARLTVKFNNGSDEDNARGKAKTRAMKALWELAGMTKTGPDNEDDVIEGSIVSNDHPKLPTTSDPNEGGIDPIEAAKETYRVDLDKAEADSSLLGAGIAFDRFVAACGNLWSPDLDTWAVAAREATIKTIHEQRRKA